MGTPDLRIDVAIATHDRPLLLARTLDSLARARRPEGFGRVLVVENGGSAAGGKVCAARAGDLPLEYHQILEPGKNRALQWAMERLGHGFVLLFDDDVRVGKGVLEAYAAAIREHGRGHFYGGPIRVDHQDPPPDWLLAFLPKSVVGWEPEDPERPFTREKYFRGANYGAFIEDILAVGGFNVHIGPGSQRPGLAMSPVGDEREIQKRLRRAGITPFYVPDATIWHWVPTERCTAEWALHRGSSNRYSRTMLRELQNPSKESRWRGVPVQVWQELLLAYLHAGTVGFAPDPATRFRGTYRLHRARGEIMGHREAARIRSAAAAPSSQIDDDA